MAMIVVGSLEIFNQTGQTLVLIRLENPTQEHYNSAFTVTFMIGTLVVLAILIVAPFSVAYFHEPRAVTVMQVLALRAFVGGFENAGTIDFRCDRKFNRFFIYNVAPKILSVVVTIVLAVLLRNYRALVVGTWSASLRASPSATSCIHTGHAPTGRKCPRFGPSRSGPSSAPWAPICTGRSTRSLSAASPVRLRWALCSRLRRHVEPVARDQRAGRRRPL